MKKTNIAILGCIGVGKTTILNNLHNHLSAKTINPVLQISEPSVSIPFINDVLKKFYDDNSAWSYPLQLCISAAQEAHFQTLRESEYDYALMDMPFSSDIYAYSHQKNGRMDPEYFRALLTVGSHFSFDFIVLINESKEKTIEHVKSRNKRVEEGTMDPDKKDVEIDDFSYLNDHIDDFNEYINIWLTRFKRDNPNIKIIELTDVPNMNTKEYEKLLDDITNIIIEGV